MVHEMKSNLFVVLSLVLLSCASCSTTGGNEPLRSDIEPLKVLRADGSPAVITVGDAMAYHHAHEDKAEADNATGGHEAIKEEGLCAGVASGYQAVRYAVSELFDGPTPEASDIEISATGRMPGVWDVIEMYLGRKLERPKPPTGKGKLSLESFTFEARRVSSGETVRFRLRDGLIPERFFELKSRGLSCDDPEVKVVKNQATRRILNTPPKECFRRMN